jgi:D-psicose/D-tagatose/L-ribulose 3-epimerase
VTANPIGACTWIWVSPFRDAEASLAGHVRSLGFDVLEVCIEELGHVSAETLGAVGEETGIAYSVCGAFGPDRDLASSDPEPRANALA